MRVAVLARVWGSRMGGPNGMAIAAGLLTETLEALGHDVRRAADPGVFEADLTITTVAAHWRRHAKRAQELGATSRLCYWHHAGGLPQGFDAILAAPPAIAPEAGWSRHVVLPPSSWAAEEGGERVGQEIVVAGAGPAKGGHIALQVARAMPNTRWLVLRSRSSEHDRAGWRSLPSAHVADDIIEPATLLGRARLILSPTRFEVHPLLLVEAAVRGIPIVCSDLPSTREAAGPSAFYVPMNAPAEAWAVAVHQALSCSPPKRRLPPYRDVVASALEQIVSPVRAAA